MNLDNELVFDAVRGHAGDDLARRIFPDAPWAQRPDLVRHGSGSLPEPPLHVPSAGSNNWVVSACAGSASGAPIVANDPHVPLVPAADLLVSRAPRMARRARAGRLRSPATPRSDSDTTAISRGAAPPGFRDGWDL